MDADTRHQLKQNELAEALGKLRDLKQPRYLYPLIGLLVIAIVAIAWLGYTYSQHRAAEQNWQRLLDLTTATVLDDETEAAGAREQLRTLIQETKDPGLGGYARLQLARAQIDQAINHPEQRQEALGEAKQLLTAVIDNPKTSAMLRASVLFALANTHESLREFDAAAKCYESLANKDNYTGSPYVTLASQRLEDFERLTKRVAFEPGDPPAPEPVAPSSQPAGTLEKVTPAPASPEARAQEEIRRLLAGQATTQPATTDTESSPEPAENPVNQGTSETP